MSPSGRVNALLRPVLHVIRRVRGFRHKTPAIVAFLLGIALALPMLMLGRDEALARPASDYAASALVFQPTGMQAPTNAPWSRLIAGEGFEKVTSVGVTPAGDMVFGGVSLDLDGRRPTEALRVVTSPRGLLKESLRLDTDRLEHVVDVTIAPSGAAFVSSWQNRHLAIARYDTGERPDWVHDMHLPDAAGWGRLAPLRDGGVVVAIAGSAGAGRVGARLVDAYGQPGWALDFDTGLGEIREFGVSEGADGSLWIAGSGPGNDGVSRVWLARLDPMGHPAWETVLPFEGGRHLADIAADARGLWLLSSGEGSGLSRIGLGGVLRKEVMLPALVAEMPNRLAASSLDGDIFLIGVLSDGGDAGGRYLARFDPNARPVWQMLRHQRPGTVVEDIAVSLDGLLVAGGAASEGELPDAELLLLALSDSGAFPPDYGGRPSETGEEAAPFLLAGAAQARSTSEPAAHQAEVRAASLSTRDGDAPGAVAMPASASVEPRKSAPQTAGPAKAAASPSPASVAVADITLQGPAPLLAAPMPASQPTDVTGSPAPQVDTEAPASAATAEAATAQTYHYACTFTCRAPHEDLVKYPVRHVIRNVSDADPERFSSDMQIMTHGVCMASGGTWLHENAEPVCEAIR